LDLKNAFHTVDHDIFTECVFGVTEGIENNWFERYTLNIEIKSVLLMVFIRKSFIDSWAYADLSQFGGLKMPMPENYLRHPSFKMNQSLTKTCFLQNCCWRAGPGREVAL
jgi:hypothetical protein